MLAAVVAFLADEATDLLLQRRVLDPFAVVAHGVDKEALAIGEQHRHGVEHVGLESVAAVPMARHRIGQVEVQMTRADLQTFGVVLAIAAPVMVKDHGIDYRLRG